jgi:heme/copper-type cytochrome/quinol oxidase subunit 2
MAALTFIDQPATFEPKGENMVMTLQSGDVAQSFILPRGAFNASMGAGMRAMRDWFAEQQTPGAEIVKMPKRRARR